MAVDAIKAFSNPEYNYYKLRKNVGNLRAGAIFYHDPDDDYFGSIANGCLKLCWTPDGNCYSMYCGGTFIFHCSILKSDLFEKVAVLNVGNLANSLNPGKYELEVKANGDFNINKIGVTL